LLEMVGCEDGDAVTDEIKRRNRLRVWGVNCLVVVSRCLAKGWTAGIETHDLHCSISRRP
jgi:hypothetical protein